MNAPKIWTVLELIQWTTAFLKQKGVENARRETEDLLGHVLELDRLKLYLAFETIPSPLELSSFRELVARRAKREPLQYLLGWQPFLGLKIKTDARALIPRPETEALVELALQHMKPGGTFADVGTGSGCIALALLRGGAANGIATDISPEALELAKENAKALELDANLEFLLGPGLDPLEAASKRNLDLLISNPPYLGEETKRTLMPELDFEPRQALFSGSGGLDMLRGLAARAAAYLKSEAWMALECGEGQATELKAMMTGANAKDWIQIQTQKDQYGVERFLLAQRS